MTTEEFVQRFVSPLLEKAAELGAERAFEKAFSIRGLGTGVNKYPTNCNIRQASEITGLAATTLYQMHSAGQIPAAFKSGGKLLFRRDELIQWVENR